MLVLIITGALHADQPGSITGTVTDDESGSPLPGVNILILELERGTASDSAGNYEFRNVPPGMYTLEFSYIGYERRLVPEFSVRAGLRNELDIRMQSSFIQLETVEVRGSRFRQPQDDTRTSIIQLRPQSARVMPGAGEDVLRTLQAMPGVVTRSDFSSQLVIRGGGPDQNLIVMDDIEVFNPYRLYGLISMFNPETISGINLITGGFPVRYGDRLSAVLDVDNREGRRNNHIEGNINTNITNANIVLEGQAPLGVEGSWLLSARRTYYDLIAGPIARSAGLVRDDVAFPNFTDLQTKITIGPYDGHRFYINSLISRDAVNIISGENRPTPDSIAVTDQTDHGVIGLAWHYIPSNDFYSKVVLSFYRNRGDSDFDGQFLDPALDREDFIGSPVDGEGVRLFELSVSSLYEFRKTSLSNELSYTTGSHAVTGGGGIDFLTTQLVWRANLGQALRDLLEDLDIPLINRFEQARSYARLFGFVSDKWRVTERLVLEPGLRFDHYSILDKSYISPRFNISLALDDRSTVRSGIGRYLQSPGYEKIFGQTQFFDLTDREAVNALHPEEAIHYIAGIDRWFSNTLYMRLEGYYKDFRNLISVDRYPGTRYIAQPIPEEDQRFASGWTEPLPTTVDSVTIIPNNDADGYAYGFELFLEKQPSGPDDRLSGWISYTYSLANRRQYERTLPFDFDQRHTLNIVTNYRFSDALELGARWRYGSGFPHTQPVGIRPRNTVIEEEEGETTREVQTDSQGRVIFNIDRGDFSNRNSARLPEYSRIDVRLNWYTSFWGIDWLFYLDVINILNRRNVLGYRYSVGDDLNIEERASTMFPIIPTFGFSFRF
jgi:hypothetical protein